MRTKDIEAPKLQQKLIEHWKTLNTTKHDFKQGVTTNPYRVGTSNVLKLLNKGICSPRTYFIMLDFFKELEDVNDKDDPI